MTEVKHTPGPWRIAVDSWGRTEIESDNPRDNSEDGVVYVLASSIGGRRHGENYTDFSEVEANSKLIAAAPVLLQALIQLHESLNQLNDSGDVGQMVADQIEIARAAIAKATQ
jgi:hypothetical protein